jgi:hypothetical protein
VNSHPLAQAVERLKSALAGTSPGRQELQDAAQAAAQQLPSPSDKEKLDECLNGVHHLNNDGDFRFLGNSGSKKRLYPKCQQAVVLRQAQSATSPFSRVPSTENGFTRTSTRTDKHISFTGFGKSFKV